MQILFARAITTSTARASSVSPRVIQTRFLTNQRAYFLRLFSKRIYIGTKCQRELILQTAISSLDQSQTSIFEYILIIAKVRRKESKKKRERFLSRA